MCRTVRMTGDGKDDELPPDGVRRTVMWSPPRSLSTTVERALIEHPAIHVLHEPFGLPYYWSSQAASSRESSDTRCADTDETVARRIFEDRPPEGKRFVFSKNLSYYVSPHCLPQMRELLGGSYKHVRHSFMIRHPAKAISSLYYKSCIDNEKTGYTHFDPAEAGYTAMAAMMAHLDEQPDCPPYAIIDADDLLEDPAGMMEAYCDALALPFDESMLSWQPGPVPELASPWTGWTDDVQQSSGIRRRAKRSAPPEISSLPQEVQDTINEAMPIYDAMYARRIRAYSALAAARRERSRRQQRTPPVAATRRGDGGDSRAGRSRRGHAPRRRRAVRRNSLQMDSSTMSGLLLRPSRSGCASELLQTLQASEEH